MVRRMVRGMIARQVWLAACTAVLTLAVALPAVAQSTGMIRGVVKDATGKPVEGAKVNIDADANNRHFDTKSDKKGEFIQIGLPPGQYKVSAEKDKMVSPPANVAVRVNPGSPITIVIGAGGGGGANPEAAAKNAELKKVFEEGVAASRAGNHDEAIAKFARAAELNPNCFDCYYNMAFSHAQKKELDKAEAAYKKSIESKPDYAEAYSGLANIYNMQRKFDEAAVASAKATELSSVCRRVSLRESQWSSCLSVTNWTSFLARFRASYMTWLCSKGTTVSSLPWIRSTGTVIAPT